MMNASLLILTLALGGDEAERPAVRHVGLAGLISSTAAVSRAPMRRTDVTESRRSQRESIARRRNQRLAGGGADASQLIGLIQTTIAPNSWQAPVGVGGFGGFENPAGAGVTSRRDQLIDLIQETIEPESWDINGGPGTISVFAQ